MNLVPSTEIGCQNTHMIDVDHGEVAARLHALMRALHDMGQLKERDNVRAFAAKLKVNYTRLHNVMSGSPLARSLAVQIASRVPGLTTDFLWFGDIDSIRPADLRHALSDALRTLMAGEG